MEANRFDAVARLLATNGSRRQALRALIGGTVAGLIPRQRIDATTSTPCGLTNPSTLVFGDDFEGDDLPTRWDTVQGLVVESGTGAMSYTNNPMIVPGDTYVARAISDGSPRYARKDLGTPGGLDDLYFRVRFKIIDRRSDWIDILSVRTADDEPILGLGIDEQARLGYRNDAEGQATIPAGVASPTVATAIEVQRNNWHTVQIHLQTAVGNGRIEVWYDGTQVSGLSNDEEFGGATVGLIQLGESESRKGPYDLAFDEVVVATSIFQDCGGSELCCAGTCVPNDLANCGTCGHACPGPLDNAVAITCTGIGCRFACTNDFVDCDLNWENGCEQEILRTDSSCTDPIHRCDPPVDCTLDGKVCDRGCCCEPDVTCACATPSRNARYI